ncbi:MAG: hypothetical protein DDT21_02646 [Syntrophomonadaceae bacterium]|nr:hypothetical protein [Bacillota bacterium]
MRKIPYDIESLARIRPEGRDDAARARDFAAHGIENIRQPRKTEKGIQEKTLKAIRRQGHFQTIPFTVTTTPLLVRQSELRTYFLIQNTGTNPLYIGFDTIPTIITGLAIVAGGFGEPIQVPSNDIWIVSVGTGTTGVLWVTLEN